MSVLGKIGQWVADPGGIWIKDNDAKDKRRKELQDKQDLTEDEISELALLQSEANKQYLKQQTSFIPQTMENERASAAAQEAGLLTQQASLTGSYGTALQNTVNDLKGAGQFANDQRDRLTGEYKTGQDALSGQDQASLGTLGGDFAGYKQLSSDVGYHDVNSDPALVAQQQGFISTLGDASKGGLDYTSKGGAAAADQGSVAAQLDALNQYKALSTPQETAAEKFLREKARTEQFRQEQSNRDAVMRGLSDRGLTGAGQGLANTRAASLQNSQNRMLSDLGANAQAVERSMAAMQGYSGLSSTMRNSSFDEALKRGLATDAVSKDNVQNRLVGAKIGADEASTMRGQGDAVSEFNAGQQTSVDKYNADYKAQQQKEAADRALALNNATRQTTAQVGNRNKDVYGVALDTTNANYDTTHQGITAQANVAGAVKDAWGNVIDQGEKNVQSNWDRFGQVADTTRGVARDTVALSDQGTGRFIDALEGKLGRGEAALAANEARDGDSPLKTVTGV